MSVKLKQQYVEFLISRIFVTNTYSSTEELLEEINKANRMDESTHWREKKAAFNSIAMNAPMIDNSYFLTYQDVPAFIESESNAFVETFDAIPVTA